MRTTPAFSPDGNQIAFDWEGEDGRNVGIYAKVMGVPDQLRLTKHSGEDKYPAWSPNAPTIAFRRTSAEENGIFLVPATGSSERRLTSLRSDGFWLPSPGPKWSPDAKFIVFPDRDSPHGPYSIFSLSLATLETQRLTNPPGQYFGDTGASYSPNGQTIAFIRIPNPFTSDIYLISRAGGEPRRLTFDGRFIEGLDWTPGGDGIIFSSDRGGNYGLWRISASGGTPKPLAGIGENAFSPCVSPKGNRLAYVRREERTHIYRTAGPLLSPRVALPEKFILSTQSEGSPQFSPDGKRIAFVSDRSGNPEIWTADSDGSSLDKLTSLGGFTDEPQWSPDGQQIACTSCVSGNCDIYVVNRKGGKPLRLTTESFVEGEPSWSADGQWIYFSSEQNGDEPEVWKVPAQGGQALRVIKRPASKAFESADGRFVYFTRPLPPFLCRLMRIPVSGGEETTVFDQLPNGYSTASNSSVYFVDRNAKPHPTVQAFNLITRQTTTIASLDKPPESFTISPDGRWILYAQVDHTNRDIMLVENFR